MDTTVIQSVAKGAAKTFFQAALVVFVPLFLAWAAGNTATLTAGGEIDIDLKPLAAFGLAAVIGGLAATVSYIQNRVAAIPS